LAANAEVIELGDMRMKANFDIAQARAKRQSRERHCANAMHRNVKRIEMRESFGRIG
jgi:hypothetical protein